MLQAEEDGKCDPAVEEGGLLAGLDEREDQKPVEESVVLEMDVVDDEKAGG